MSLIGKLKNIFNKKGNTLLESKDRPILQTPRKYENMTLFAPPKVLYEGNNNIFYVEAFDKDNNPIVDETVIIKYDGEEREFKTDEEGMARWYIDVPPGKYELQIRFPDGDYSQILESRLTIRKEKKKPATSETAPKAPKTVERDDKYTSVYGQNMKMYINSEGQYYARLRDKNYDSIQGKEILITINNETHKCITDERGYGRVDIENLPKGTYDVICEFEGDSEYNESRSESTLQMEVRDIDRQVMIEVDHLTMEFKVTKDKIDTLKEFIIRTLKRNKESHEKIRILDDITFKVYKGDRLGILGFNGAGKSTLLKIMSGIYEPTHGSIKTYGKIAPLLELGAGFDKNYTGKNNIYLNGAFLSIDEKVIDEKYDEIVEFSELGDFINYPIKNYSSGMRTKLGFSIATQVNPDILIIDEILSVGDIKFKKKSAEKIDSMMKEGVTVLLVTHSVSQMKRICDRCIWLENGKIKMYGESEEVCDAYVKGAKKDYKKNKKKK